MDHAVFGQVHLVVEMNPCPSKAVRCCIVDGGFTVDRDVNLIRLVAEQLDGMLTGHHRYGPGLASFVGRFWGIGKDVGSTSVANKPVHVQRMAGG